MACSLGCRDAGLRGAVMIHTRYNKSEAIDFILPIPKLKIWESSSMGEKPTRYTY
jgi:hypothetical protein